MRTFLHWLSYGPFREMVLLEAAGESLILTITRTASALSESRGEDAEPITFEVEQRGWALSGTSDYGSFKATIGFFPKLECTATDQHLVSVASAGVYWMLASGNSTKGT